MFDEYVTKTGRLSCKQPQEVKNQWYILKFQEIHGDTYDYSQVKYSKTREKVLILCKQHGEFLQYPNSHLKGEGCPKCQSMRQSKTTQQCVQDFQRIHKYVYDYSMVVYTGQLQKVEIICKIHGGFLQKPNDHLNGQGCPKCQHQNQNTLYVLKCLDTGLIKIGITNNLDKRISGLGGNLQLLGYIALTNPRQVEKVLHKKYQKYQRFNTYVRNGGTEFFQLSEAQVIELIQNISSSKASILL